MTVRLPRSQLPCFQHVIVLGKGGPVFLWLLSQCWGLDVKCPPPKVPLPRAWSWRVSRKDISPLWTLLFLNLFPLSDSPTQLRHLSLSPPGHHEMRNCALQRVPCHVILPLLEPSSNGACLVSKKKKKEKKSLRCIEQFFVTAGKGWLNWK